MQGGVQQEAWFHKEHVVSNWRNEDSTLGRPGPPEETLVTWAPGGTILGLLSPVFSEQASSHLNYS